MSISNIDPRCKLNVSEVAKMWFVYLFSRLQMHSNAYIRKNPYDVTQNIYKERNIHRNQHYIVQNCRD